MRKISIKGVIIPSDVAWIYDLFGIEHTTPTMVNKEIDAANGEDLEVIINSSGGDVYSGSEIYTSLREYPGKVTNKIVGVAASAASVIAMSGYTKISPTAQLMIHNASSVAWGDHRDLKHGSDFLRNWDKSITNAYMLKSGMSQEELLELMDQETWFNAQQAKEKKLVDEIMFDDQSQSRLVANIGNAQMIPQKVIDTIRNKISKDNPNKEDLKGLLPDGFVTNQIELPTQNKEEEDVMDLEKLKNEHPELYNQIRKEGYEEGVKAENARIKSIEDLGIPGSENLVAKAKFETMDSAERLAVNIVKDQKVQGKNYLSNREGDAADINNVAGGNAPEGGGSEDEERKETATNMAGFINKKRGGTK